MDFGQFSASFLSEDGDFGADITGFSKDDDAVNWDYTGPLVDRVTGRDSSTINVHPNVDILCNMKVLASDPINAILEQALQYTLSGKGKLSLQAYCATTGRSLSSNDAALMKLPPATIGVSEAINTWTWTCSDNSVGVANPAES